MAEVRDISYWNLDYSDIMDMTVIRDLENITLK